MMWKTMYFQDNRVYIRFENTHLPVFCQAAVCTYLRKLLPVNLRQADEKDTFVPT